jgi:hypothetical protein
MLAPADVNFLLFPSTTEQDRSNASAAEQRAGWQKRKKMENKKKTFPKD